MTSRRIRFFTRFLRDARGAAAAEFALVAFIFVATMLAIVDISRFAWELNSAKAATRAGARLAVVSDMVSTTYADYDGAADYGNGQPIPADALEPAVCTSGACTPSGYNGDAFTAIVTQMQGYYGRVQPANVVVEYTLTDNLGTAGFPDAPDVQPMVTVRIQNMTFQPGVLQVFGVAPFLLPDMATTLSGEDLG